MFRPSIFDESFASEINNESNNKFYNQFEICYWFSNDYDLLKTESDYNNDGNIDDLDYDRENWYAMTDGMYGDLPEGFDGDYSFWSY